MAKRRKKAEAEPTPGATAEAAPTPEPFPLARPPEPVAATERETAGQVEQVRKWVLAGGSEFDVLDAIRSVFPDADPSALILAAMRSLQRAADPDPVIVFGFAMEGTRDLYRRMIEIGDFTGALRALKQLTELAKNVPRRADDEEEDPDQAGDDLDDQPAEQAPAQAADLDGRR